MRTVSLSADESGASSATGNVLLVAVVLLFVGSAALFVGDLVSVGETTPSATFSVDYDSDDGLVSISHRGGERFTTDNTDSLRVVVVDADTGARTAFDWIGANGSATAISTGSTFRVDDANGGALGDATLENVTFERGDEVHLVWEGSETSVVVREYTVGSDARSYLSWRLEPTEGLSRRYAFEDVEAELARDEGTTGSAEDAAIEKANDTEFGLGASIWTDDLERGERIAGRIDAGCTYVNELVKSDPRVPFGGVKESGYGRELSAAGITEFVNRKTVWVQEPTTDDDEVPTE